MGCLTLSFANIDKDDIEQGQSWRARWSTSWSTPADGKHPINGTGLCNLLFEQDCMFSGAMLAWRSTFWDTTHKKTCLGFQENHLIIYLHGRHLEMTPFHIKRSQWKMTNILDSWYCDDQYIMVVHWMSNTWTTHGKAWQWILKIMDFAEMYFLSQTSLLGCKILDL